MIDNVIEELTKMLIKQDLKDKQDGVEYVKISKVGIIRLNIKLLKYLKNLI